MAEYLSKLRLEHRRWSHGLRRVGVRRRPISMTPTERQILAAAIRWWRNKRPIGWTERKHLEHPLVNVTTSPALARAVAKHIAERRRSRP